jgi:hypothetical protein
VNACHTEEEIGKAVGMTQQAIGKVLQPNADLRFVVKPGDLYEVKDEKERLDECQRRNQAAAAHASDFDVPKPARDVAPGSTNATTAIRSYPWKRGGLTGNRYPHNIMA